MNIKHTCQITSFLSTKDTKKTTKLNSKMFVIDFKNKSCSKVKGKIKFSTEIKVLRGS